MVGLFGSIPLSKFYRVLLKKNCSHVQNLGVMGSSKLELKFLSISRFSIWHQYIENDTIQGSFWTWLDFSFGST